MSSIDRTERNRLIVLASIAGVLLIAVVIALAAELGGHGADADRDLGREAVGAGALHRLAARDRGLENGGVVQRFPDALARRLDAAAPRHVHPCFSLGGGLSRGAN